MIHFKHSVYQLNSIQYKYKVKSVICIMFFRLWQHERECFLKPAWQRTIASNYDVMFHKHEFRRRYNFIIQLSCKSLKWPSANFLLDEWGLWSLALGTEKTRKILLGFMYLRMGNVSFPTYRSNYLVAYSVSAYTGGIGFWKEKMPWEHLSSIFEMLNCY